MKLVSLALPFLLGGGPVWTQSYVTWTVAGGTPPATPAAAVTASIGQPAGLSADAAGNVYFTSTNCLFEVDKNGNLIRLAGTSRVGFSGDGGLATGAQLNTPTGVAVDGQSNVYVLDSGNSRIRKVALSGIISTAAGGGTGGLAAADTPGGIAFDTAGNLYFSDLTNHLVRKLAPDGTVTTVAGTGIPGFSGDGGAATGAQLNGPGSLAVDAAGNLYIGDGGNYRVRKVSAGGSITTVAGNGTAGYSGDGGLATSAQLDGTVVAVDAAGNLFIAQNQFGSQVAISCVRKVSPDGIITTFAGTPKAGHSLGDGGPASAAQFYGITNIAVDGAGNLYIGDSDHSAIRKVTAGTVTTVAGNGTNFYSGDGGPATRAQLNNPQSLALDSNGNLYIADTNNFIVRKLSTSGIITTVAGTGINGYSGDHGPATIAELGTVYGVAVDKSGNLYIADRLHYVVRKVSASGIISTLAGTGNYGYATDGVLATQSALMGPIDVAVDNAGNVYIADPTGVRKVSQDGIISTAAALSANGMAFDANGNLYIASFADNNIQEISPGGTSSTIAGKDYHNSGFSGDGGPAASALLSHPAGVAVDAAGNLYIADWGNSRIRKVSPDGTIMTVAGNGATGFTADGGPATDTSLNSPYDVAVDPAGNVYVADSGNNAIRALQPSGATPAVLAVTNGGSNLPGPIAPGEIVVLKGTGLGPAQLTLYQLNSAGRLDTQAGGTQVRFNGTPGPVVYASANQVAAIVPYSVSGATAQVTVIHESQISASVSVPVAPAAPGVFTLDSTGLAAGAILNQDYSVNSAANPAKVGSYISIFATGEGQTTPTGVDGKIAPAAVPPYPPQPVLPVTVNIGGKTVTPVYAGGAPGGVAGLLQINVRIPSGVPAGSAVPLTFQMGNASSQQGVTIAVQ